jgi:4'-phosphopantetheinyl transferase
VPAATAHIEIAKIPEVLADAPGDTSTWLSGSEQQRLGELRNPGRRAQYLAGHWLVRVLLTRTLGGAPTQWQLRERKGQAPEVHGHGDTLSVSISHTQDWIAAAVATSPIGIDMEQRPRQLDAAIEALLRNADEATGSLDPDVLLQRWVAKEAWLKRNGESALPARLMQLQLCLQAREHADVCIDSHDAFHFGLAIARDSTVTRRCEARLNPGSSFAIADLAAEAVLR